MVTLRYWHKPLGSALVDAGLVNASREYVLNADMAKDPFQMLNREMRQVALGKYGFDLDLAGAHPRAKLSMVVPGRAATAHFLHHRAGDLLSNRDAILYAVGGQLFPTLIRREQRENMCTCVGCVDMCVGTVQI